MACIFISYRRDDSRSVCGRVRDHLTRSFGATSVFKDVDSISPGMDFRLVLRRVVAEAEVVLAFIGPRWAGPRADGGARLFDPNDFVRLELEQALASSALVIPVLVDGASMPGPEDLPESLRDLTVRHAICIREDPDFRPDVRHLIRHVHAHRRRRRRRRRILYSAAAVALVGGALLPALRRGHGAGHARAVSDPPVPAPAAARTTDPPPPGAAAGAVEMCVVANDFLPRLRQFMDDAREEIFVSGVSFYISLPDNKERFTRKVKEGVRVRFLVFDYAGGQLEQVAASFGQSSTALRNECRSTVDLLQEIRTGLVGERNAQLFQVRLFSQQPTARLYLIDGDRPEGMTYIVTYVPGVNSPALPGMLIRNGSDPSKRPPYRGPFESLWDHATTLEDWAVRHKAEASGDAPSRNPATREP